MKKLSLAIALALGSAIVSQSAIADEVIQSHSVNTEQQQLKTSLRGLKGKVFQSQGETNFTQMSQVKRMEARFEKFGLNAKNRPHLFNLIEQQGEKSLAKARLSTLATSAMTTDDTSGNCVEGDTNLCSFFSHMGFSVLVHKETNEPYLVASALNSERALTNYTMIDLTLVNENWQAVTLPNYTEFFGDDTTTKKRKAIESSAPLASALELVRNSESVYADAWVTVVTEDENGVETVEDRNAMIEYSRDDLLRILEEADAAFNPPVSSAVSIMDFGTPATGAVVSYGPELTLEAPIDSNSVEGTNIVDQKITICLNRNYGDCDYENIYPLSTPVADTKLKIPFKGELSVPGQVEAVYKPSDILPTLVQRPTNIFIQTKENGGATTIGDGDYADIQDLFADSIVSVYDEAANKTLLTWDIARDDGMFGDASLFGRYQDAHWIMNIALSVKRRPTRPASPVVYIVGSSDPDTSFFFEQPVMQMVYSCLAKGSMITLASGKPMPIERLNIGDTVLGASEYSPHKDMPLVIEDISIGVETIPMVEITTSTGETLLLTESHPVLNVADQPVWANALKVGDRIQTQDNKVMITSIRHVDYDDNVYNLKLARPEGDSHYDQGESFAMYANGLLVGDLSMQSENEFKYQSESRDDVLNRLPTSWHTDFLNSQQ
ncbi:Hint domain-containing protein [Shewanella surugensis]|uniref:Hint domain-containing protein n=1 Tax=Shewanella surugensis TaxID=212020 RepID=A0ABT0LBA8_9GAMM|nr:Hint domain-containing protein [Shewanella surugensis]MCL1124948.1 Hint domain-containing protein [Shewanella surugensis]